MIVVDILVPLHILQLDINNLIICWQNPKNYTSTWTKVNLPISYTTIPAVLVTVNEELNTQSYYVITTKDITISSFKLYQNLKQSWITIGY